MTGSHLVKSSLGEGQRERLERARAALAAVEGREHVRSVSYGKVVDDWENKGVHHLDGHIETLLEVLSTQPREDFIALVGVTDVGWDRAANLGINVEHVVVIADVPSQAGKVVGTLLEGFSVVVVGEVNIAPRHQRALAGRARKLRNLLLMMNPWVGVSTPHPLLEGLTAHPDVISGVAGGAVDGAVKTPMVDALISANNLRGWG